LISATGSATSRLVSWLVRIDLVRHLLDQGVDPNEAAAERMPCCPLRAAAGGGDLETVELLVARDANVANDPAAMGHAVGAFRHVDPEGRVLRFLLAHGGMWMRASTTISRPL
jgi:hypothetical protein